jgi:hypothetical protein
LNRGCTEPKVEGLQFHGTDLSLVATLVEPCGLSWTYRPITSDLAGDEPQGE